MGLVVRTVLQAIGLTGLACAIGLVVNWARPQGLPLVADKPYEIYKPCPVVSAEAEGVAVDALPQDLSGWVLIDSRRERAFEQAHPAGARPVPYDPLQLPEESVLTELRREKAAGILVIGDNQIDSGRLLGAELAGAGLRGVRYLQGGFDAWRAAGRPVEKGRRP
mgnify:CR=1 FL=1